MRMHRMHIVIGGYGRVGRFLARKLELEGHTVAVIDANHLAFEDDDSELVGARLLGQVFDRRALEEAGIERADVFAAVTSGDNSNIVSARIAKERYQVPRVVARIYDPERAEIYRGLGISTIASVTWAGAQLFDMIAHPDLHTVYTYGNAEMVMVEVAAPQVTVGRRVADLEVEDELRLTAVLRRHAALLPSPELQIEADDVLYINVVQGSADRLAQLLGEEG
jgi:trk system potassium uptake protein TrkA